MTNVLILGASGNIAGKVIEMLSGDQNAHLTLFVRNSRRLQNNPGSKCTIREGDALRPDDVVKAMKGIDIVYANLSGDLEHMAENIVNAMTHAGVKRLIFICSIGIYSNPVKSVLIPYRKAADVIEKSDLDYTILRPTWFTDEDEVDYELTRKGEPEKGSVISQKSIAAFIVELIRSPQRYLRESLGINKPNS